MPNTDELTCGVLYAEWFEAEVEILRVSGPSETFKVKRCSNCYELVDLSYSSVKCPRCGAIMKNTEVTL